MKQHQYRITLEHLADPQGRPSNRPPLQFEVGNHDDIIAIVERLRGRSDIKPDEAAALGVGLKLFGEVMLANKDHALFSSLRPHFAKFMKDLKKGPSTNI
jgi:uncharacterized protein DUF3861